MNGPETKAKSTIGPDQWDELQPFITQCLKLNHDLNNPLAGIIGYCEFLMDDSTNLDDGQRKNLDQILTCAERIKNHIDALCEQKMKLSEKIDLRALEDV